MTQPPRSCGHASPWGAVVLAGGGSTRMGRDKASLPWGPTTWLGRIVDTLAEVVGEVVVVARRGQPLPTLPDAVRGVPVRRAHDEVEGRGPLEGLAAGLEACRAELVYASGCDTPRLRAAFVRSVLQAAEGTAVAIPEALGRLHPLAAAYRRLAVLPQARALLGRDRLRPVFLLEGLPHVRVPETALRKADPALASLDNLNTPEDCARAGDGS